MDKQTFSGARRDKLKVLDNFPFDCHCTQYTNILIEQGKKEQNKFEEKKGTKTRKTKEYRVIMDTHV